MRKSWNSTITSIMFKKITLYCKRSSKKSILLMIKYLVGQRKSQLNFQLSLEVKAMLPILVPMLILLQFSRE